MESRLFYTQLVLLAQHTTCAYTQNRCGQDTQSWGHLTGGRQTVNNETNEQTQFNLKELRFCLNLFFELVILLHVSKFQKYQKVQSENYSSSFSPHFSSPRASSMVVCSLCTLQIQCVCVSVRKQWLLLYTNGNTPYKLFYTFSLNNLGALFHSS